MLQLSQRTGPMQQREVRTDGSNHGLEQTDRRRCGSARCPASCVPPTQLQRPVGPEHRWAGRLLAATAWIAGCMALFALYLRISFAGHVTSDGRTMRCKRGTCCTVTSCCTGGSLATRRITPLTFRCSHLPRSFSGCRSMTSHVSSALTYLVVTVCALALALRTAAAYARVARCVVVVAVLTAHVPPRVERAVTCWGARPHRYLGVPPGFLPADLPARRPVVHVTAAARDPVRRPDRRRHGPLRRRAGGRRGLRLSRGGRTEGPARAMRPVPWPRSRPYRWPWRSAR